MSPNSQPVTLADLQRWFSAERMDTYVRSAQATGCDVADLYVWNGRISKALLEDVAHVEVLLRNFMSVRLAKACGHDDWYRDDTRFRFNCRGRDGSRIQSTKSNVRYDTRANRSRRDVW